jgi:hypothetical protein
MWTVSYVAITLTEIPIIGFMITTYLFNEDENINEHMDLHVIVVCFVISYHHLSYQSLYNVNFVHS